MKPVPDPYRVLGLAPGASSDEVRRAYRRLAKRYHPDSAGDDATARFLAIQSAYESLVSASPRAPGPRRASSRPAPGTRPGPGPAAGPGPRSAGSAAGRGAAGSSTGSAATGDGRAQGTPPRTVRKARLGSTSYDDAEGRDPQWQGATWYGQASGTYWTINPKEYADPRKHGPEYQARGRRSSVAEAGSGPEAPPIPEAAAEAPVDGDASAGDASVGGATAAAGADASWTWRAAPSPGRAAGGAPPPPASGTTAATGTSSSSAAPPPASGTTAATGTSSSSAAASPTWTVGAGSGSAPPVPGHDRPADRESSSWRVLLPDRVVAALVAWPVLGLAAAGLAGQLTGCARFSASCATGADLAPVILQPLIIGALLLLPRAAEAAAVGTVAVVLAAVPAAIFLSATGASRAPVGEAPAALIAILGLAWTIGVAAALAGRARIPGASRRG